MRWIFICVACLTVLLVALFLPILGAYISLLFVMLSLVPAGLVETNFGPAINGFARAHGWDQNYLTAGIVAAPFFCLGVYCLIKALWDRDPKIAALGIASLGYLALTVLAYFQFTLHG